MIKEIKIWLSIFIVVSCNPIGGSKFEPLLKIKDQKNGFDIHIIYVRTGATSPNTMQVRRVYQDSTFEIISNIGDRDSIVSFYLENDTIQLRMRGKQWANDIPTDSIKPSVFESWTTGRFRL